MYSIYMVISAAVIGCSAGFVLCAMFSVSQVDSLQKQLWRKCDLWCKDCDIHKRLSACNDRLADREAYVRSLEERIATLTRSNRQLGLVVQKKSWGRV